MEFYGASTTFLSTKFNHKPYYKNNSQETKIIHFHGAKPHDYVGNWLGIDCKDAYKFACEVDNSNLCSSLRAFSIMMRSENDTGDSLLQNYCLQTLTRHSDICVKFFQALRKQSESCNINRVLFDVVKVKLI